VARHADFHVGFGPPVVVDAVLRFPRLSLAAFVGNSGSPRSQSSDTLNSAAMLSSVSARGRRVEAPDNNCESAERSMPTAVAKADWLRSDRVKSILRRSRKSVDRSRLSMRGSIQSEKKVSPNLSMEGSTRK
jgi:hypothetical protein